MISYLTLFSPLLVALTWLLLNLNEHSGLIGLFLIVTFLSINILNVKNYKEKRKWSIVSTIYIIGFFILSFQTIWAKHYTPSPKGFEESKGYHKHNYWDTIFMHMH